LPANRGNKPWLKRNPGLLRKESSLLLKIQLSINLPPSPEAAVITGKQKFQILISYVDASRQDV
jgi:hypothetical protein